jgi:hypothetical protein
VFFDLAGNFLSMPDISGRVKKEGTFLCDSNTERSFTLTSGWIGWLGKKALGR